MRCFALLIPILLLCACDYRPEPQDDPQPASTPAASNDQAPPPSEQKAKLSFEPDTFEDCEPIKGQVATIRWDATESGAVAVDVVTMGSDGTVGSFASGGAVGEKQSGPWMTPGTVIAIRDHATGVELARTIAKGKPCS